MRARVNVNSVEFTKEVLDVSTNSDGTWSYAFLTKCYKDLALFTSSDTHTFVSLVLENMKGPIPMLSKFKLAQFLSLMRSQDVSGITEVFNTYREDIQIVRQGLSDEPLTDATSKLLLSLLTEKSVKQSSFQSRFKSSSHSPAPRSVADH